MDVWVFKNSKRDVPESVYIGVRSITYEGHEDCYILYLYSKKDPVKVDGSCTLELKA